MFFNRNVKGLNFGLMCYLENSDEFEEYFEWALIIYLRRVKKENKLNEFRLDSIRGKIIQLTTLDFAARFEIIVNLNLTLCLRLS